MTTKPSFCLQIATPKVRSAFTLMETVIAIGVLAVLLTGFLAVFTPAAQGIRRSISSQQADRLTSTLEREMVTLREGQETTDITTGFDKAFDWLLKGNKTTTAQDENVIFVYQYRGDPSSLRDDGTPTPMEDVDGQPGVNYTIQSMARRASDPNFKGDTTTPGDISAIEGSVFYVKPSQLVLHDNSMKLLSAVPNEDKESGKIQHPIVTAPGPPVVVKLRNPVDSDDYNEAVLAISAEFYSVPTKSYEYLTNTGIDSSFKKRFDTATKPVFTRNLAVRR